MCINQCHLDWTEYPLVSFLRRAITNGSDNVGHRQVSFGLHCLFQLVDKLSDRSTKVLLQGCWRNKVATSRSNNMLASRNSTSISKIVSENLVAGWRKSTVHLTTCSYNLSISLAHISCIADSSTLEIFFVIIVNSVNSLLFQLNKLYKISEEPERKQFLDKLVSCMEEQGMKFVAF